ncbi:MAG: RNA polymerase sigma factor [Ilumatobacteraceae bacterium]
MGDETDAELVAASIDTPARFGPIFDRHATVLHRYLVRRLGPNDAESMVGEVFRIAFQRRASYDLDRADARPWLYGIATNLVAKQRRTEGRRVRAIARLAAQRTEPPDLAERTTDRLAAGQQWERVAEALTSLPQPELDALVLHVWESLPYAQVAEALGVPIGTVRSRLNRARARLRELAPASGEEHVERTEGPTSRSGTGRIGP